MSGCICRFYAFDDSSDKSTLAEVDGFSAEEAGAAAAAGGREGGRRGPGKGRVTAAAAAVAAVDPPKRVTEKVRRRFSFALCGI